MKNLPYRDFLNIPADEIVIEDVFHVAMEMEKKGERLYYLLADKVPDVKFKELLLVLSEEESRHYKKLTEMAEDLKNIITRSAPGTLAAIAKYTRGKMFDDNLLKIKLKKLKDMDSIFEFAISVELDSILLYQELKDAVSPIQKTILNDLIDQERLHFLKLLQLKQTKG